MRSNLMSGEFISFLQKFGILDTETNKSVYKS